jgi:hypothetical protein
MTSIILMKKENYLGYKNDLAKKALVSMSIEKALLDVGKETYDEVAHELYKRYNSYFQDCYEHPEYLSEILTQLYGNAGKAVVDSIKKQLEEFSDHDQITRLLKVISK